MPPLFSDLLRAQGLLVLHTLADVFCKAGISKIYIFFNLKAISVEHWFLKKSLLFCRLAFFHSQVMVTERVGGCFTIILSFHLHIWPTHTNLSHVCSEFLNCLQRRVYLNFFLHHHL